MATIGDLVVDDTAGISNKLLLRREDFNRDFFFGAGSAAYQHEGAANIYNRGTSIWDEFCLLKPGKIKHGQNGTMACNMYHNYKEDIKIMKKMGLTSFRMSISWTRIFPGGRLSLGVNNEGVKHYNDVINELLANGIEPFVTLFHWDFPQTLQEEYDGFLSSQVVDDFCEYAEFCFIEFGDRVKHWITFNEPYVFTVMGYGLGAHAPGRGLLSAYATGDIAIDQKAQEIMDAHSVAPTKHTIPLHAPKLFHSVKTSGTNKASEAPPYPSEGDDGEREPYTVAHHILLCHRAVVNLYWKNFKKWQKGKIGIVLNCEWVIPAHDNEADREAKERALDFMIGWFLEPLTRGHYPKRMTERVGSDRLPPPFPDRKPNEPRKYYDFVGINYYTSTHVEEKILTENSPINYFNDVAVNYPTEVNGQVFGQGASGRYIYPRGIYELLCYVNNKYENPLLYVTENGMVDPNNPEKTLRDLRNDVDRAVFILQHLACIREAKRGGVNVNGYFVWSFLDGFEWSSGYECRLGLVYVDYSNNFARHPKKSAVFCSNFLGGTAFKLPTNWFGDDSEDKAEAAKPRPKRHKT